MPLQRERDGHVERLIKTMLAAIACIVFLVFVALLVAIFVLFAAQPSLANEQQIRRDCRADALHYCTRAALRCLAKEDDECRLNIITCMAANKAKLKPNCARWMW